MTDKRKTFDDSSKLEIVKMIKDQGLTVNRSAETRASVRRP